MLSLILGIAPGVTLENGSPPRINETRIDQASTDNDEYFELKGQAGFPLNGMTYIVIGDDSGGPASFLVAVSHGQEETVFCIHSDIASTSSECSGEIPITFLREEPFVLKSGSLERRWR